MIHGKAPVVVKLSAILLHLVCVDINLQGYPTIAMD